MAGFDKRPITFMGYLCINLLCMLQDVEHKTLCGLSKYSTTTLHDQTFLVWTAFYKAAPNGLNPNISISQPPTCWNYKCILPYRAIQGFGYKTFYSMNKCIFGNKHCHWIYMFWQVFELKKAHNNFCFTTITDFNLWLHWRINKFCIIAMIRFIFCFR